MISIKYSAEIVSLVDRIVQMDVLFNVTFMGNSGPLDNNNNRIQRGSF